MAKGKSLIVQREWQLLKKQLTPEQQEHGEKVFYCGALMMLAECDKLTPERYERIFNELSQKLALDTIPTDQPN